MVRGKKFYFVWFFVYFEKLIRPHPVPLQGWGVGFKTLARIVWGFYMGNARILAAGNFQWGLPKARKKSTWREHVSFLLLASFLILNFTQFSAESSSQYEWKFQF